MPQAMVRLISLDSYVGNCNHGRFTVKSHRHPERCIQSATHYSLALQVSGLFCVMFGIIAAVGLSQMQVSCQLLPAGLHLLHVSY